MIAPERASDVATIIRWVEGKLDRSTSAVVAEAAVRDARTQEILGWLRGFHRQAAALPLVEPPPPPPHDPPEYPEHGRPARERARAPVEVIGRMLFDSRQDMAPTDLCSVDDDRITHLAFACDLADVVLDVRRHGAGRVTVGGQVLPSDGRPRSFTATASGSRMTPVHSTAGDARGRFQLFGLPDRVGKLRLCSGELAVVVQFDAGWS